MLRALGVFSNFPTAAVVVSLVVGTLAVFCQALWTLRSEVRSDNARNRQKEETRTTSSMEETAQSSMSSSENGAETDATIMVARRVRTTMHRPCKRKSRAASVFGCLSCRVVCCVLQTSKNKWAAAPSESSGNHGNGTKARGRNDRTGKGGATTTNINALPDTPGSRRQSAVGLCFCRGFVFGEAYSRWPN